MNTRIFTSVLSILAVVGAVSATTYALFSDTASSVNNVFAAETLDLQVGDANEAIAQNVSASFSQGGPLTPGESVTGWIQLKNPGTTAIDKVLIGSNQISFTDNGTPSNIADVITLTIKTGTNTACTDNATDYTSAIAGVSGNTDPTLTLTELSNAVDYDALPGLAAGGDYFVCITSTLSTSAGNEYQGDTTTQDFVFTAQQI